jgi:hypothetical protein
MDHAVRADPCDLAVTATLSIGRRAQAALLIAVPLLAFAVVMCLVDGINYTEYGVFRHNDLRSCAATSRVREAGPGALPAVNRPGGRVHGHPIGLVDVGAAERA